MADLERLRDIIQRVLNYPRRKGEPPPPGPATCICGHELVPTSFYARMPDGTIGTYIGLSCPRLRCQGNFKERYEKEADTFMQDNLKAMRMDGIDRELLRQMGIEA